jgi:type VI secretion system ImpC/EvpB family protein
VRRWKIRRTAAGYIQEGGKIMAPRAAMASPAASAPGVVRPEADRALLDAILDAGAVAAPGADATRLAGRLASFLEAPSPGQALRAWLGPDFPLEGPDLKQRIARRLGRDIAWLDELLQGQVNAILHAPAFQKLEASWRGLRYLTDQVPEGDLVKIRVLDLSLKTMARDLKGALEFDHSVLFRKVYSEGIDMPGAEPYGALIGDYEFTNHPEHIELLGLVAGVAAAAFAPFISAAHPSLLDLDSFAALEKPINLARGFEQIDYLKWRTLRQAEDARFIALTLPRILLRAPYRDNSARTDHFCFKEEVGKPDRSEYLWGNAAYAYGGVLVRAFAASGWLADVRGVRRGEEGGGLVTGLPNAPFRTDRPGLVPRPSTEVVITDALDKELGDLGFLPLCWCQDTHLSAFYGTQTIQQPKPYDEVVATVNARLSAMLQNVFCAARFGHYIKVMARQKVGGLASAHELEDFLGRWLQNYINATEGASPDLRARYPLREARVEVAEVPRRPGQYTCKVHLRPQFQLDQLAGSIYLKAQLGAGATTGGPS